MGDSAFPDIDEGSFKRYGKCPLESICGEEMLSSIVLTDLLPVPCSDPTTCKNVLVVREFCCKYGIL